MAEEIAFSPSPLEQDLRALFNRHGIDNLYSTPDLVLAAYVMGCSAYWAMKEAASATGEAA